MSALIILLIFIAVQLLAAYIGVMLSGGTVDPVILGRTLLVLEGTLASVLWFWIRRRKKTTSTSTVHTTIGDTTKAVSLTLLSAFGISFLLQPFDLPEDSTLLFEGMKTDPLCLLTICIIGPLTEELVFRAHIIPSLRANGLPPVVSATLSALAFALIHGNIAQGIPAFLIGTLLGLLYLHTDNLSLCLPAHISNNTAAILLLFLTDPSDKFPASTAVILGAVCFLAAFFVNRLGNPLFSHLRTSPK